MPFTRLLLPTFGRPMIATPIMALSMSCSSTAFGGGSICASEQKEQSQHLSPECVLFPGRHSNDGLVDVLFLHRIWRRKYLRVRAEGTVATLVTRMCAVSRKTQQ